MSVPLSICIEQLAPLTATAKGATSVKLLKKILQNVLKNPTEPKFRKLNAVKLMPKLAAGNIAPIYIIEHAGFEKKDAKYILSPEADTNKIAAILTQIDQVMSKAAGGAAGAGGEGDGLTKKEREELEWKKEQKRLEEMAERKKRERDARRAAEAIEEQKRLEAEKKRRLEEEPEPKNPEPKPSMDTQAATADIQTMEEDEGGGQNTNSSGEVDSSKAPAAEGMEVEEAKKANDGDDDDGDDGNAIDVSSLPPKSTLDSKLGDKKGQIQVVSEDGKAMVYQWSGEAWTCVGEATQMKASGENKPLDDEMKKIVERLKQGKSLAGGGAKPKKKSKKPANFSSMTLEEKHAWAVKERAKKARALEKQREKNRKEIGKAQAMLAEQSEWQKLQQAARQKRKEEREAKKAKKKLLAKMKRERAQRNKEIAEENKRLLAEQAERRRQQGLQ